MNVNDRQDRCVLVVHVPKTAGTTLRVLLEQQHAQLPWFVVHHDIEADRRVLVETPAPERGALRCIFGHMWWGWHEYLPAGRAYAYTTMLRDPVERLLSLFSHARLPQHYLGPHIGQHDIEWFLTSGVSQTGDNGMVRQLCGADRFLQVPFADMMIPLGGVTREHLDAAIAHLDECAVVGTSERFDEYLARCWTAFGWRFGSYRHENVTRWPRVRQYHLTRRQRLAVEQATRWDRLLYQHATRSRGA
jgi:hypothetical protein